MRRPARYLAALAFILVPAQKAAATRTPSANFFANVLLTAGSPFGYLAFSVTSPGPFILAGIDLDGLGDGGPSQFLFNGRSFDGSGLGAAVDLSVRSEGDCGSFILAGFPCVDLEDGDYTFVGGFAGATEADARLDTFATEAQVEDNVDLGVSSYVGTGDQIDAPDSSTAPEPASVTLVATGLLGAFVATRPKRRSKV